MMIILQRIPLRKDRILMCGDFNVHVDKIDDDFQKVLPFTR